MLGKVRISYVDNTLEKELQFEVLPQGILRISGHREPREFL